MSRRGLAVLVTLLAMGISALVWLDRNPRTNEGGTPEEETLFAFASGEVSAVAIESRGKAFRLERSGENAWKILDDGEFEADPRRVDSLVSSLKMARVVRTVERETKDLRPFGLDPPEAQVRLWAGSAPEPFRLRIGRTSPVGSERFASRSGTEVLLVDSSTASAVEQDREAFRERRLFPVRADEIHAVVVERRTDRLVLHRAEDGWSLDSPIHDRADDGACEALARSLADLEVQRFTERDRLASVRRLFERPRITVTLEDQNGRVTMAATLADASGAEQGLGGRVGSSVVGTLPPGVFEELEKAVDAYRERSLGSFSTPEVLSAEMHWEGAVLEVSREKEGAPWKWSRPETAGADPDPSKVATMLDRIQMLRASGFDLPAPDRDLPNRIVLRGATGEILALRFGAVREAIGPDLTLRVASSRRPGIGFRVPRRAIEGLPSRPEDLESDRKEP